MPELPEVEVTRRSFAEQISGAQISSVFLGKPLRWPLGVAPESLVGRTVLQVRRRGKYLLVDLDRGLLMLHLGMSGSLRFASELPPLGSHDHFQLTTTHGLLRLHDPRRFGAVMAFGGEDDSFAIKLLSKLGPEPLEDDFDFDAFKKGLKASRLPVKQLLLSGKIVVGVGNIYASEVLFLSGIRPTTSANKIGPARALKLHTAIREVLARAVATGGSTLRDFSAADGNAGHFQLEANVYGREGQPCKVCGAAIKMLRQGQRSTFFCAHCQKP
ncbi:bifunctional DNA-formamidopyrimidine glycosylase/DNA-(apurinic or apyrimidinic site) lyase [Diaphorobacter sp. HDW4B]|uniref:bifunctional DNA-formamidopyrimidine glycosylase/DNA-(apurinic or apyrimidinic site) lyase n=1 Tax=Diaphorobacter sp. HDW4B TaxID=2714925 RepID=UPI0014073BF9|nr:bifunctional DNA-formamidopyrimidine glycosylase/DNA-(apurinic or apyrimidinic site) lyase [Diaphorobacter sp. HDW4B]QIL69818.1 bifunctional DNA-formamidopyrimidine glycosylase/DNA-(apurinic or apyrimidinic site) lyase [Diaphorobacter sp. HDW4B]